MPTSTEAITIRVSPEAARIYQEADEQQRRKLDLLMDLQLLDFVRPHRGLEEICREAGEQAKRNGLMPQILEELLNE